MQIILVHGWGFHAGLWSEVVPRLKGHEALAIDLGFIRDGPKGASSMPADAVCVGHSFGLVWLLKHGPRPMKGLVSLAGVDCWKAHLPVEPITEMKEGLLRNPAAQMRGFWRACGIDDFTPADRLDVATLRAGLDWLATWDGREQRRSLGAPILALAAEDDQIVPKPATQAMWGGGDADLRWRKTGGHALPLTEPDWCAEQILEFVDGLEP